MQVVISADAPEALTKICGVSLLERQLRILQRLRIKRVTIISSTVDRIRAAIEPPSWARSGLSAEVIGREEFVLPNEQLLSLPGNLYIDARLLRTLVETSQDGALIDSDPPEFVRPLLAKSEQKSGVFESGALVSTREINRASLASVDAVLVPAYIKSMRRHIRPVFFPAPPTELLRTAERLVLDTAQNGTLDIPAIIQSPIETWIMRGLCRTAITPNQISVFNLVVAFAATALFATGHLWSGMIPALAVGVIDGLDGKQARVKIETTPGGKWEHYLDFVYETSWWAALAFWFQRSGQLPSAWLYFFLIMAAEGLDKLGKHVARVRIDTLLDDYAPFDRFVRLIGARRDVYIWALTIGLALAAAPATFRFCAAWGMLTAGVHWLRAGMIVARSRTTTR